MYVLHYPIIMFSLLIIIQNPTHLGCQKKKNSNHSVEGTVQRDAEEVSKRVMKALVSDKNLYDFQKVAQ